jgi:hypothetical protein
VIGALVPVTVSVYVLGDTDEPTLTPRADVAGAPGVGVTEVGDGVQVTPVGHEAVKVTGELKPFSDDTVIVDMPELPC